MISDPSYFIRSEKFSHDFKKIWKHFLLVLSGEIIEVLRGGDKSRLSTPYSKEQRSAANKQARQSGVHKKVTDAPSKND